MLKYRFPYTVILKYKKNLITPLMQYWVIVDTLAIIYTCMYPLIRETENYILQYSFKNSISVDVPYSI